MAEVHLQELLVRIKEEGAAAGRKRAEEIIRQAEEEAAEIVRKAGEEAALARQSAEADVERFKSSGKQAVTQAARDLVLDLKKKVITLFEQVVGESVASAMDDQVIVDSIVEVIKAWSSDGGEQEESLSVLLPPEKMITLEQGLRGRLSGKMEKGIEIRPQNDLNVGFAIGKRDGAMHYDFSSEGIALILCRYLSPRFAELMRNAVKE